MSKPARGSAESHPHTFRNAWLWVASLPFVVALAVLIGEWLLAAQGYQVGGDTAVPIGPILAASVPAMAVVLVPSYFAFRTGMRARREGNERGLLPALLGVSVGLYFLVTNIASLFNRG